MKKITSLLLVIVLAASLFVMTSCFGDNGDVMTWEEYNSAALDSEVVIEGYVQATQSWWDNKITVYLQDRDGAYFLYEMTCSEEDAAKLTPGTKIRVTGYKSEWAGEVEITDATFEFCTGKETYIAPAFDATSLLGTDDLIKHQNEKVLFTNMTVKEITYKNFNPKTDTAPSDDIYVTLTKNGVDYDFCVEVYLTGTSTEVYQKVCTLNEGDVIDVVGFLYWYEGVNTHITSVTVK